MADTTIERADTELEFHPPGPGSWSLDKGHVPRPATRFHHEAVPEVFGEAFARMFARYGIPAHTNRQVLLHGFCYTQLEPLAGDDFGARAAAAEEAIATRLWRLDLRRWDEEVKPASIARHLELAAIDVDGLDDDGLCDHLQTCAEHVRRMIAQHHEFNGATMVPLGDFLAHAMDWTGLSTAVLLELFAGASPASRGDCPELAAVREALADDPGADAILRGGGDAGDVLARLRGEALPATATALERWLALVGHRIVDGFDVDQPRAIERPSVLLSCLRRSTERAVPDVSARLAEVRALVPEAHRETFDDLYREAFDLYRLRDERGVYSDSGAFGLMRRAMLSTGVRLVVRGVLDDATLAIEAGTDELVGLVRGAASPSAEELRARRALRHRLSLGDAPPVLGDAPSPPPPFELLPPAMGRVTRAIITFSGNMVGSPGGASDDDGSPDAGVEVGSSLQGLPASPGIHEGAARVIHSIDDLERVEEGDVIIAITTGESFNLALSLAAAVVTDQGGLLSHAAILAREYGIPAVVGTEHATSRIPDGTMVRVDGTNGVATW